MRTVTRAYAPMTATTGTTVRCVVQPGWTVDHRQEGRTLRLDAKTAARLVEAGAVKPKRWWQ